MHRVPEAVRYEACSSPDFDTGAAALRAVTQNATGPTVIRLSDEAETGVNLATTEAIGDNQITGGCLAITAFEGTKEHVESRHAETSALLAAQGGTSLGDGPARAWERGRFGAPYLRDSLLAAGALCETLETATSWSNQVASSSNPSASGTRGSKPRILRASEISAKQCRMSPILYLPVISERA